MLEQIGAGRAVEIRRQKRHHALWLPRLVAKEKSCFELFLWRTVFEIEEMQNCALWIERRRGLYNNIFRRSKWKNTANHDLGLLTRVIAQQRTEQTSLVEERI